jgi:hypothetical protein
VGRRQPAILNFFNLDFSIAYPDSTGGFLSPVSGIAFHFNFHRLSPMVSIVSSGQQRSNPKKMYINMPFFLKSKAVFTVELKFLIPNFCNANQKENSFWSATSNTFYAVSRKILIAF